MEIDEYISLIKEQLRAYDFNEENAQEFSQPLFTKTDQYTFGTKIKIVVMTRLSDTSVDIVKNQISDIKEQIYSEYWGISGDQDLPHHNYLLIVPTESSKPMKTAVKRGADDLSSNAFFLPLMVDLQEETLSYKESELTSNWEHRMMVKNIPDYFKL